MNIRHRLSHQQLSIAPAPHPHSVSPALPSPAQTGSTAAATNTIHILEVSGSAEPTTTIYHLQKFVTTIGRHPDNDIVVRDRIVSNFHAQILYEHGQFVFIHPHPDRKQTLNGIRYQDRLIDGQETFRQPLSPGDRISIGSANGPCVTFTYHEQPIPTTASEIPQTISTGHTDEQATYLKQERVIQLVENQVRLGRHSDNDIVLCHPQVAGYHARLVREGESYRIVALHTNIRVYVNAQPRREQVLQDGDELFIGPYRLRYEPGRLIQYAEQSGVRIDALHLTRVSGKTVLLNDISLTIPAHSFVALVGGSGTGKSTLLDALNGLRPAQQGQVLYNGQDYYRHHAIFSKQLGYVPQEDIVHRDLTVERALYYSARIRLPGDFTHEQIQQRIDEVLEDVDIKEQRTLLINKLSGGQRKRVSIALELLDKPSVFFLDEPTSGLDPGLDYRMMHLLRKLADKGQTIVLVTHATSNICICDYVCFLAHGGRLAYFGPPQEALTHFGVKDFAEIYGLLEPSTDYPDMAEHAETRFKQSADYQKYVVDLLQKEPAMNGQPLHRDVQQRPRRCSAWQQFVLLAVRYLELLKNDPGNLMILLLQAPIIALLIVLLMKYEIGTGTFEAKNLVRCSTTQTILSPKGLPNLPGPGNPVVSLHCERVVQFLEQDPAGQAFAARMGGAKKALQSFIDLGTGGNAQKVLFILGFTAVLFGCVNAAREIVKEAPIYRRERAVSLGILPYMFSKIVVLALLCLLQSAILVAVVNTFDPFHQGIALPVFLEVSITMALTSLAGLMMGLAVSAIAPSTDRAMSFIPILLIPQVIFSGTVFPFKDWPTQSLAMVFAARWSMAALGSIIGLHSDRMGGDKLIGNTFIYHGTLFSVYSQAEALHYLLLMWSALGAMTLILMLLIGIFLKMKDRRT